MAVIYIPTKLGGFDDIFAAADKKFAASDAGRRRALANAAARLLTLAFGSALALFIYPHSARACWGREPRHDQAQHGRAAAYSIVLGLIALLGYMAIAAGVQPTCDGKPTQHGRAAAVRQMFPSWFAGVAFAAIGIGALVPAAIMSIAAANLLTRNIYKEYLHKSGDAGAGGALSKRHR